MRIATVRARDLRPGDVIGEGMQLWAVHVRGDGVAAWWGGAQDEAHRLTYSPEELVRVARPSTSNRRTPLDTL